MVSQLLTFCLQYELVSHLDRLDTSIGRDRAYHLQRALEQYGSAEEAPAQAVRDAIKDVETANITSVWRQKWRRVLTLRTEYLRIDGERLRGDELVNLFVDYINAFRAHEQLQQQAPRVSGKTTQRGFTV